ncbi:glutathione S-transferase Mu 4-like [Hyalella azteca]|uniref:glutathione transferase n=1 Tax=Hyalella azteca TaxID=294128 RepID=A0A8B7PMV1_HYAAZ|nr:glutathione S-transferase Mu 4-like [Hyalella azteca]
MESNNTSENMVPVLGYWAIRGLAQVPRYMLVFAEVEFEEKQYTWGTAPDFDRGEWTSVKDNLGLEFPNLPYFIDGEVKMTESSAITKHLARRYNLLGSTEEEHIRVDMAEGIIADILCAVSTLCHDPEFETKLVTFIENLDVSLLKLAKLIKNNSFVIGEKLTWVDFALFELLEIYLAVAPDSLEKHPSLQAFHKRIRELPGVKEYRLSEQFRKIKCRFFSPEAMFGSGLKK